MAQGRKVQKARSIDLQKASVQELKSFIANEGKRLNRQITQIEKDEKLQKTSFAYRQLVERPQNAQFLGQSKSGYTKINLSTKGKQRSDLQQIASLIQRTAASKTITKRGIKEYYEGVFKSLRETYPGLADLSDDELSDILLTEGFESAKGAEGSDRIFQRIAQAKDAASIKKYIEKTVGMETVEQRNREYKDLMGTDFVYTKTDIFAMDRR